MKKKIFESNREFRVWAYTVSHNSLLIRSEMKYPDQENYCDTNSYNIDIELWDVKYINIPNSIKDISILQARNYDSYNDFNIELNENRWKVFEFLCLDKKYFIVAGGILIGTNKWINQDRVFYPHLNLEHDKVIINL